VSTVSQQIQSGASTPYKRWTKCTMEKVGGRFCRNLGESALIFSTKLKIFYTGTHEFDNVLAI